MSAGLFQTSGLKIVDGVGTSSRKTVAVPGTAEALVAVATGVRSVLIQALSTNTLSIYVGFGTLPLDLRTHIAGVPHTGAGFELTPGAAVSVEIDDAQKILVDVDVAGEGCTFQTARVE